MPLVTTTDMFKKAYDGGYAVGAFNINNMEFIQAITEACDELKSPVILQCSAGAIKYAKFPYLVNMVKAAAESTSIPIALHLDHGANFDICKECIDNGFTSVMIDASSLPYEENIELSKKVAEYAHEKGCTVEAELGTLSGVEDDVNVADDAAQYTNPDQVEDFMKRTGVDSLAIAIGTSHGAFKFKPGQDPKLRLDILEEVVKRLPGFPIVLHGSSAVPQKYVGIINANGGAMKDAIGIPDEQLRAAAKSAVCKINIDSDLRLGMTAGIRQHFAEHPEHFDPRQYLGDGRAYVKEIVHDKIINVLGSDGKA
ncbi:MULTISPECIES: class II fructose-1,6-bisphosphate aldolase [unclassified Butyrivibrio]|uniref:class II fructose-1,6-bisphosphate aldolase n=1 Tax=unclassified Butyrivibrio TaxID=2639466 RepID=UPI000422B451|nr:MULTISPECIES: class II fructose-1,6-bisphosphate aldolase [unclassified Butyrivibrio]